MCFTAILFSGSFLTAYISWANIVDYWRHSQFKEKQISMKETVCLPVCVSVGTSSEVSLTGSNLCWKSAAKWHMITNQILTRNILLSLSPSSTKFNEIPHKYGNVFSDSICDYLAFGRTVMRLTGNIFSRKYIRKYAIAKKGFYYLCVVRLRKSLCPTHMAMQTSCQGCIAFGPRTCP